MQCNVTNAKAPNFPKLMQRKSGMIVLFYAEAEGVVVCTGSDTAYHIGENSIHRNMDEFKDFDGKVELNNG